MPKQLTVSEATRRLGITIDAVYRLIYAGKLPARKSGRRWLISVACVEERLRARAARDGAVRG